MKPSILLRQKAKEMADKYPKMKAVELLEKNNGAYLGDDALYYYGNNINYDTLFRNIYAYSNSFKSYGIGPGDYVSVCLPTLPESIYTFYALNKLGAVYQGIVPMLSSEQIVETLKANKSKFLIVMDKLYYRVGDALKEVDVPYKLKVSANTSLPNIKKQLKYLLDFKNGELYRDIPKDVMNNRVFLKHGKKESVDETAIWTPESIACVTNSSGSTSLMNKATMLTDYGFNAMVTNYQQALSFLERGKTFHSCIPILYSTGISNSVNLPLQLGLPTHIDPLFNKDLYPASFMEKKPNYSIVPPPHAKALLDYLRKLYCEGCRDRKLLSFVDVFSVGGSHLHIPWEEELEYYLQFFGSSSYIGKGYGLSEHNSALTISVDRMIGAAGVVLPGVILGIFDPITGEELDFGQEGEIRAISPSDMAGYFNNQKLTDEYWHYDQDGNRWGKTGDIGKLELIDGKVWLFYSGRAKEKITINEKEVLLPKIQEKVFSNRFIDNCEIVTKEVDGKNVPIAHIVVKVPSIIEDGKLIFLEELPILENVLKSLKETFVDSPDIEPYAYKIHDVLPVLASGKTDKLSLSEECTDFSKYDGDRIVPIDFSEKVLKKIS